MDATEVRGKLLDHYNNKNQSQIRNIYSLTAFFIGVILSDSLKYLPEPLYLNGYEFFITLIPLFFYFFIRSRYWAAMVWSIMYVKPIEQKYGEDSIYEDNVFAQLNHACTNRIRDEKSKLFYIFKIHWTTNYKFKYLMWMLPLILFILIQFI